MENFQNKIRILINLLCDFTNNVSLISFNEHWSIIDLWTNYSSGITLIFVLPVGLFIFKQFKHNIEKNRLSHNLLIDAIDVMDMYNIFCIMCYSQQTIHYYGLRLLVKTSMLQLNYMYLYMFSDIGNGWIPVILNSQTELEFILENQRSLSNNQSFWIAGSTRTTGDIDYSHYFQYELGAGKIYEILFIVVCC